MSYGYNNRIGEIDLTNDNITEISVEAKVLQQYIGGRGLATKILWDRLGSTWTNVDPLGPENLLIALVGPLTGYMAGARICVTGKSPLTNGIVGSTSSAEFPLELKCAGFDGIIVKGKATSPVYILVTDGQLEIRDATKYWGMDGKETTQAINKEVRNLMKERDPAFGLWKEPGILYIGPAGEKRLVEQGPGHGVSGHRPLSRLRPIAFQTSPNRRAVRQNGNCHRAIQASRRHRRSIPRPVPPDVPRKRRNRQPPRP